MDTGYPTAEDITEIIQIRSHQVLFLFIKFALLISVN